MHISLVLLLFFFLIFTYSYISTYEISKSYYMDLHTFQVYCVQFILCNNVSFLTVFLFFSKKFVFPSTYLIAFLTKHKKLCFVRCRNSYQNPSYLERRSFSWILILKLFHNSQICKLSCQKKGSQQGKNSLLKVFKCIKNLNKNLEPSLLNKYYL